MLKNEQNPFELFVPFCGLTQIVFNGSNSLNKAQCPRVDRYSTSE